MDRIVTAFRVFFAALFDGAIAIRLQQALANDLAAPSVTAPVVMEPVAVTPKRAAQSEAITLLSTLQREARLIDFLQEDLTGYTDDQVGAAVREIQRESASVLNRLFAIRAVVNDQEGQSISVPVGYDAARYRLTGKVTGNAPFQGTLQHHGWEATKCEIPEFVGGNSAAMTIAPAEVELQ